MIVLRLLTIMCEWISLCITRGTCMLVNLNSPSSHDYKNLTCISIDEFLLTVSFDYTPE